MYSSIWSSWVKFWGKNFLCVLDPGDHFTKSRRPVSCNKKLNKENFNSKKKKKKFKTDRPIHLKFGMVVK